MSTTDYKLENTVKGPKSANIQHVIRSLAEKHHLPVVSITSRTTGFLGRNEEVSYELTGSMENIRSFTQDLVKVLS